MDETGKYGRYRLRRAAGMFWLLDVEQESGNYKSPIQINEIGANIFEMLSEGKNREEIITSLAGQYEISVDEVTADVDEFIEHLRSIL